MRIDPPYLFSRAADDGREAHVAVLGDVDTALIELSVHARNSAPVRHEVSTAIGKCLAELPSAVIVDLRDFADPDGSSVPLWIHAHRAAVRLQPPVQLMLCVPAEAMLARRLHRAGAYRYLPTFPTMPEARAAVRTVIPQLTLVQLHLPPEYTAAAQARDLVGQACYSWQLPRLLHPARQVMSELVSNAVQHARTDWW